ncbi:hypothetical protein CV103_18125 [Sphingomonas fennica]|nr:hypothetical protein CV103_18125 [Sphingomonas fennica]
MSLDAPITHQVTVEHAGKPVAVTYDAEVVTRMKTVGTTPPPRPSSERCRWKASVTVIRQVHSASGASLNRTLPEVKEISGQRPGTCMAGRKAIMAELDGKIERVREHLRATAEADRPTLLADIDAARTLALN